MPINNGKVTPVRLPEKHARVLLDQSKAWRYRVLHGGRSGAKDWSAASVVIEKAARTPIRVLCTREIQKTIKDSIHQLLCDTIKRDGFQKYFYPPTENYIKSRVGAQFMFTGLRDISADNLKSLEGVDLVILGEAQNLTEKSWNILDPTIRKTGSEIWIIYNDQFESDFVYQLTQVKSPENMICELVNYTDLPKEWVSPEIVAQAERMKKEDFARYENIWLGMPSRGGKFFSAFGDHCKEESFPIPFDTNRERVWVSIDHGITHPTSAGVWYLDDMGDVHRMYSYKANGGTAESHADAICDCIDSFPLLSGVLPDTVYYDPSMDTTQKLSERLYQSVIGIYKEVFKRRFQKDEINFLPANNRKIDGCQIMQSMFSVHNGQPIFRYFDKFNSSFVDGIRFVKTDENNTEIYAKMDGDDEADECRYGMVAGFTKRSRMLQYKREAEHKAEQPKFDSGASRFKQFMAPIRMG